MNACTIEGCVKPTVARGWCWTHYQRWRRHGDPLLDMRSGLRVDEFWAKVTVAPTGCWEWTGSKSQSGYGRFGRREVHRIAYELTVGTVPPGLHLDHLCRVRHCANPDHLEPVTPGENQRRGVSPWGINARKTHCIHGHPFDDANTYVRPNGNGRSCRQCVADAQRRYQARKVALRRAGGA